MKNSPETSVKEEAVLAASWGQTLLEALRSTWLSLLLASYALMQLLSLFLFAELEQPLLMKAIGLNALPIQGGLFLFFFLLLLFIRQRWKHFDPWLLAVFSFQWFFLLPLLFLPLFAPSLAFLLLALILLWTVREDLAKHDWWKGLLFSLPSLLIFILCALRLPTVLLKETPPLAGLDMLVPRSPDIYHANLPILASDERFFLLLLLVAAAFLFSIFLAREQLHSDEKLTLDTGFWAHGKTLLALLFLGAVTALHLGSMVLLMTSRVEALMTPTYDFGLFSQMFAYMRRTGLPLTTLERDGLFSHLKVHSSYLVYVFLPFYLLFPKPETIQILQLLAVVSGTLPLLLIGKELKLSRSLMAVLASLYLLQPGLMGSSLYDFHENCLYAPFLLWLVYALLKEKLWAILLTGFLTLAIKEDAMLYTISLGLWQAFRGMGEEKSVRRFRLFSGLGLIFASLAYGLAHIFYLAQAGAGAMTYRFENLLIYPEWGLASLPLSLFQNPLYWLALLTRPQKVRYLFMTLLATGFLPCLQKKRAHYLLFLPLLFMNLLPDYPYQVRMSFQYNYGSHALLMAMVALALAELPKPLSSTWTRVKRASFQGLLSLAILAALGLSTLQFVHHQYPIIEVQKNQAKLASLHEGLAKLPRDRSIACSTFLSTALADCPELYDISYNDSIQYGRPVDLVVFDLRHMDELQEATAKYYRSQNYQHAEHYSNEWLLVLEKDASD